MARNLFYFLFLLVLSFQVHAQSAPDNQSAPEMKISGNSIRLRTLNGDRLCTLSKDTVVQPIGINQEADQIQVVVSSSKCKGQTGFVDIHYLRAIKKNIDESTDSALIATDGLALRSTPKVSENNYKCGMPSGTPVEITGVKEYTRQLSWVQVKFKKQPPKGCPEVGWASAAYLKPDIDLKALLPVVKTDGITATESTVGADCTQCGELAGEQQRGLVQLQRQAEAIAINRPLAEAGAGAEQEFVSQVNPFLNFLKEIENNKNRCPKNSSYACNRGLVRMPVVGENAGFCGSHHYGADNSRNDDAYAAPHTACAAVALAQEWKKSFCTSANEGCRLAWGDISHKTRPRWNGHATHTDGECIDIRPMSKGEFTDFGKTYRSGDYDRNTTRKLLQLAKKMGATELYFNDPQLRKDASTGAEYMPGHDNHVHFCFRQTPAVAQTCAALKVNPKLCPEVQ